MIIFTTSRLLLDMYPRLPSHETRSFGCSELQPTVQRQCFSSEGKALLHIAAEGTDSEVLSVSHGDQGRDDQERSCPCRRKHELKIELFRDRSDHDVSADSSSYQPSKCHRCPHGMYLTSATEGDMNEGEAESRGRGY